MAGWGACVAGGSRVAGKTAIAAGSMHPIGMHSCLNTVKSAYTLD